MALWDRAQTLIFGAAVGRAGSEAVTPVLEPVRQRAWSRNKVRVLGIGTLADLAAKGFSSADQLLDEAGRNGYNAVRLDALVALAQRYPDLGILDTLSNRRLVTPAQVDKALSRHGIPGEYHAAIKAMFADLLSPGELAAAIHRGLVPNDGLVLGEQPEPPFKVDAYPVYPIDPVTEAQGSGYDRDRLGVLVGLQGLPMGVIEAAHSFWRKIITHGDYIRAFNTSNSRNEWAQAVLEYSRQIPTARDFLENALRGYTNLNEALAGAELHGMTPEHATLIYQNQGRPMNIRQITMALARGAHFNPEPGEIQDPYHASIVEGPVKPGYYELAESLKYTNPSVFAIRGLVQSGVWSAEKGATRLKWSGWLPADADEVAAAWAKGTSTATKEATATDLLTLYDGGYLDPAATLAALTELGYPPDEAQTKLDLVDARRAASAKNTAISDLHAAFKKGDLDGPAVDAALNQLALNPLAIGQIVASWQAYRDAFPPAAPVVTPPPPPAV